MSPDTDLSLTFSEKATPLKSLLTPTQRKGSPDRWARRYVKMETSGWGPDELDIPPHQEERMGRLWLERVTTIPQ